MKTELEYYTYHYKLDGLELSVDYSIKWIKLDSNSRKGGKC